MINSEEIARIEQASDKQRAIYLSMKERLEDMVRLMNMMNYGEKLEMTSEKLGRPKVSDNFATGIDFVNPSEATDTEEQRQDTGDIYICTVDNGITDLFREIKQQKFEGRLVYVEYPETRFVYVGLNSNIIAGHMYYPDTIFGQAMREFAIGEKTEVSNYVASAKLISHHKFEDVRRALYKKGLIPSYEIGSASLTELNEVLTILHTTSIKEIRDWFIGSSDVNNKR